MLTYVEFRSDRFPPYEGEEEQISPGKWGKRLPEFLRERLRAEGIVTEEPCAEDWGWGIPMAGGPFRMWIGCQNYEHDDGYLCFIEPHKASVWRRFRRIDTRESVARLQAAMDRILTEEEGIRAKRWWTHEEFNFTSTPRSRT
jgi:hypothetical protein